MPYDSITELPPAVRERYSAKCQRAFMAAFNGHDGTEASRFRVGHTAARRCMEANDMPLPKTKATDLSLSERQEALAIAIRKRLGMTDLYVADVYDDRAIYTTYGQGDNAGKSWEIEYSIDDDAVVTLGDEPVEVKRRTVYQAVKFADDDEDGTSIEGLAIPFGGPIKGKDIDGEDFGPDTDLCLDWFPDGRPILYHHGLNGAIKTTVVGRQTGVRVDEEGAWVKAELDKRSRWYSRVKKLIDAGGAGFSSGAMPHLVQTTKSGHIKRWPWVELSLTPTNAHPGAVAYAVKAAVDAFTTDDEQDTGSVPFDAHAERVASDVADFVARAKARIEARSAKAGRELSEESRTELDALVGHLATIGDLRGDVQSLLDRTGPGAKAADIVALEAELALSELRRAGHID